MKGIDTSFEAKEQGKKMKDMSLEEMDALWDKAKQAERAGGAQYS